MMSTNFWEMLSSLLILMLFFCKVTAFATLSPMIFDDKISKILEFHNIYRACHGTPDLILDSALTKEAQKSVEEIAGTENLNITQKTNDKYGENLFIMQWPHSLTDLLSESMAIKRNFNPVDVWYDELRFYRRDKNDYQQQSEHFTQIVWKNSKNLGCGVSQNDKHVIFVLCYYHPPGNVEGQFLENVLPINRVNVSTSANGRCIYSDFNSLDDLQDVDSKMTPGVIDSPSNAVLMVNNQENDNSTSNLTLCQPTSGMTSSTLCSSTTACPKTSTVVTSPPEFKSKIIQEESTDDDDDNKSIKRIFYLLTIILVLLIAVVALLTLDFIYKLCICCRRNGNRRCSPPRTQSVVCEQPTTMYPPQRCLNPGLSSSGPYKTSSPTSSRPATPPILGSKTIYTTRN